MDSENRIIAEMANYLPYIQEDFLISIANKGIYKRALKDLEKARGEITFSFPEEGGITARVQDVTVKLSLNLQESVCSCPSGSICKHILMTLFALQEYYEGCKGENNAAEGTGQIEEESKTGETEQAGEDSKTGETEQAGEDSKTGETEQAGEDRKTGEAGQADEIERRNAEKEKAEETGEESKKEEGTKKKKSRKEEAGKKGQAEKKARQTDGQEEEGGFQELRALTAEKAQELIGKKEYKALLASILIRDDAEFQYGALLTVTFRNQNVKVYFPKEKSIANAMCSCKEKKFCRHKGYALLSYLLREKKIRQEEETDLAPPIGEKETAFLRQAMRYIENLLDQGIAGMTESETARAEEFYKKAYGLKMFAMAEEWKSLASEFQFYFMKNVAFSPKRFFHTLCSIHNRAEALFAAKEDNRRRLILFGKRQEEKFQLDTATITGLGAHVFLSKRNDLVVSGYFYCEQTDTILSMSTLRPRDNARITPEFLYSLGIAFQEEYAFEQISGARLLLKNAMLSTGRLSSTKQTTAGIVCKTGEEQMDALAITDFRALKEKLLQEAFHYFSPYSPTSHVYVIKVKDITGIQFHPILQRLEYKVWDEQGQTILFTIPYSEVSKTAIGYWERRKDIHKEALPFTHLLGSVRIKNDQLEANFISGFGDGKVKNIFFEEKG